MVANRRTNSNGVDLNRNFPTKNWELTEENEFFGGKTPASEIETQFIIQTVEKYQPKLILTLHAPYKIVNYDGNAESIASEISKIINYPVEPSIGYPTPGSFGTWAGLEKNIPTITLELDEEIEVEELKAPVFNIFRLLEDYNCGKD
jgi:protein MpaA